MIKGEFRGRVAVAGLDTRQARPRELAGRVATLFQDFEAQIFCTRVDQEVAFGPENLGLDREELRRRVGRALSLVGLTGLEARDPFTLSGGQKQLLALASVLALEPRLLVLDEPTTDLDPWRVEELLATLDRLGRGQGLTLMLLGEDPRLAAPASRLVLLHQGRVVADGRPARVLREVKTFRRLGLSPPELPALFDDLGQTVLPLTLEEALAQARGLGWGKTFGGGGQGPQAGTPAPPALEHPPPTPYQGQDLLALEEVTFSYPGGPPVFRNFSLSLRQGELTAILGPNGSGKTTLLKLFRGLLKPHRGKLRVAPGASPLRIGFVFQNPDYQLFAEQVWEEVAFGPRHRGLAPREVEERVTTALAKVNLLDRAQEDPFSLTKGRRQQLAVASVLALAPQVIILDEPTTGLDHQEQRDLLDLIRSLHQQGHTIVMVTHSMWAAATYAQRLVVLKEGEVVLDGPTREVLAHEEALAACHLKPPAVVQLSRGLGFMALTAQEFREQINLSSSSVASVP
jgi:energy-coupling factor transport system ATP-binding protein